jgi:hypothetical protein
MKLVEMEPEVFEEAVFAATREELAEIGLARVIVGVRAAAEFAYGMARRMLMERYATELHPYLKIEIGKVVELTTTPVGAKGCCVVFIVEGLTACACHGKTL